ncbi:MAG: hypothetical protein OXC10_06720 [Rhodospirillaceae bacterium]|nr:hypothetical protein [Rhodospirillaceae bacterium]
MSELQVAFTRPRPPAQRGVRARGIERRAHRTAEGQKALVRRAAVGHKWGYWGAKGVLVSIAGRMKPKAYIETSVIAEVHTVRDEHAE